jgi:hypothetical protein
LTTEVPDLTERDGFEGGIGVERGPSIRREVISASPKELNVGKTLKTSASCQSSPDVQEISASSIHLKTRYRTIIAGHFWSEVAGSTFPSLNIPRIYIEAIYVEERTIEFPPAGPSSL